MIPNELLLSNIYLYATNHKDKINEWLSEWMIALLFGWLNEEPHLRSTWRILRHGYKLFAKHLSSFNI